MKCLLHFGITSVKEDGSAHLSDRGDVHRSARVIALVTLKSILKSLKRVIKTMK